MKVPVVLTTACGQSVQVDEEVAVRLNGRSLTLGSHGYVQIWDGEVTLLHRWILGIKRGIGYAVIADHINGDALDNRRENLRVVDGTTSNLNRRVRGRGVWQVRSGRFQARVYHQRQAHYLGTFETEQQALEAVAQFRAVVGIQHQRA